MKIKLIIASSILLIIITVSAYIFKDSTLRFAVTSAHSIEYFFYKKYESAVNPINDEFETRLIDGNFVYPFGIAIGKFDVNSPASLIISDAWAIGHGESRGRNSLAYIKKYDYLNGKWIGKQIYSEASTDSALLIERLAIADLTNDGLPDITAVRFSEDELLFLENRGNGHFRSTIIDSEYASPYEVRIADLDGDGDKDLIVGFWGRSDSPEVVGWFENSEAPFADWPIHNIPLPFAFGRIRATEPADMDGDGDIDLLVTGFNNNIIVWFENLGAGQIWDHHILDRNAPKAAHADIRDLNNDGLLDIIVAIENGVAVFLGERIAGRQSFVEHRVRISQAEFLGFVFDVAVGDYDCDGISDIATSVFSSLDQHSGEVVLLRGTTGNGRDFSIEPIFRDWGRVNDIVALQDGNCPGFAAVAEFPYYEARTFSLAR